MEMRRIVLAANAHVNQDTEEVADGWHGKLLTDETVVYPLFIGPVYLLRGSFARNSHRKNPINNLPQLSIGNAHIRWHRNRPPDTFAARLDFIE